MAMFLGLVLFYILYVVNKTAKDVNKLESFQNSVVVTKVANPVDKVVSVPVAEEEKPTASEKIVAKEKVVDLPRKEVEKEAAPVDALIKDDKERYYFIGKQLFELQPENGASKFFDEVESLSTKYQGLTEAEIKKKLGTYIREREQADKGVVIDTSTRDEIYGIAGRMVEVTDKMKKQTVGVVEDFVQPSSYEKNYMSYEKFKN